jgi:hypothetical protein
MKAIGKMTDSIVCPLLRSSGEHLQLEIPNALIEERKTTFTTMALHRSMAT